MCAEKSEELKKKNKEEIFREITCCFKKLESKDIQRLNKETLKMIDHINGRIYYYEERRRNIFTLLLVISSSILTIETTVFVLVSTLPWILISILSLLLVILLTLILYSKQTNFDYPFKDEAKTWRWFYHYCIDQSTPIGPFLGSEARKISKRNYIEDLYLYTKNTLESDESELFKQNFYQLFLLLNNERYKARFNHQLTKFISRNFILFIIITLYSILLFFFHTNFFNFNEYLFWFLNFTVLILHVIYFCCMIYNYNKPISIHSN